MVTADDRAGTERALPLSRQSAADPDDASEALGQRFDAYLRDKRTLARPTANRASDLGFPCDRYNVYRRTRPDNAALPTVQLQGVFLFGADYEHLLRAHLFGPGHLRGGGAGYRFRSEQRPLKYGAGLQIEGTPEGEISADDGQTWHWFEIKGLHPYHWGTIKHWRDFLRSPIYSRYAAQGQVYMLLANVERMVFILGRKGSYDLRWLWMTLDYDLAESYLRKAERINAHVKADTLPDRIPDRSVCAVCDFRLSCLPPKDYGAGAEFLDDEDLQADLDERARLADAAKTFEQIDERIKARVVGRPLVVAGPWVLEGHERTRQNRPRPGGITKYWQTTIRKLGGAA